MKKFILSEKQLEKLLVQLQENQLNDVVMKSGITEIKSLFTRYGDNIDSYLNLYNKNHSDPDKNAMAKRVAVGNMIEDLDTLIDNLMKMKNMLGRTDSELEM